MHEESTSRRKADDNVQEGAVPAYLLDRENTTRAKVCYRAALKDNFDP
jgi:ribosome biogenesis protein NSA2